MPPACTRTRPSARWSTWPSSSPGTGTSPGEGRHPLAGDECLRAMLSPRWSAALQAFDQDLVRRAVARATRTAYLTDAEQFAQWATARELDPGTVSVRDLRRYMA